MLSAELKRNLRAQGYPADGYTADDFLKFLGKDLASLVHGERSGEWAARLRGDGMTLHRGKTPQEALAKAVLEKLKTVYV